MYRSELEMTGHQSTASHPGDIRNPVVHVGVRHFELTVICYFNNAFGSVSPSLTGLLEIPGILKRTCASIICFLVHTEYKPTDVLPTSTLIAQD